jgi:gamma-glutamyltranspeptidase/glutathione hydrolase
MTRYAKSIIATGHELVSKAAADILLQGGNAFDAAAAAGFAGAVAEQTLTSLGGGGYLLARTGGGNGPVQEIFFDFFVDTPGLGLDRMPDPHFFPVSIDFGGSQQIFNVGLGSVAVPGTLKGLLHVHERLGRLPLADVLQPAVELCRGHRLNDFQAMFLRMLHPIMTLTTTGCELYGSGSAYISAGDMLANPAMADFLTDLPRDRGRSFYYGDIARQIEADMRGGQGMLTMKDLASYEVVERKPLDIGYRDHLLLTGPPPSIGGSLIALSLSLLAATGPIPSWGTVASVLRTTGLMREVERLREAGLSTPEAIRAFLAGDEPRESAGRIRLFSRGTTHLSIADQEGNVASMTCSNGEGSGYFAPGTGIMLNNMMGEDDLHPEGFHAAPPGERVASMMAPSLVIRDGEVKLVLGSGGSKRIRTAMSQVLSQIIDHGRDVETAVHAPRLHWDGECLQMEPGFPGETVAAVSAMLPVNLWEHRNVYFGGVHTVVPGEAGVGDPRRGGSVVTISL